MTTYVSIAHHEGIEYGRGIGETADESAETAQREAAAYYAEQGPGCGFDDPSEVEVLTYRVFSGTGTRQVDVTQADDRRANPDLWYYEPDDYDGDVLWSDGYACAYDAADAIARNEVR